MNKKEKFLIKRALRLYPEARKSSVTSLVDWAESNMGVDYGKVAVCSSPGNYKETQLCALMDANENLLRWCYVVEKVLDHFKFEKDKIEFIRMHYFDNKSEVETCLSVGICRATMFNWQTEILEVAYNWAKELKVIKESQWKNYQ